jgi:hypothetical protein
MAMFKLGVFLVIRGLAWPSLVLAAEEQPPQIPGFSERLNQALGSEGGVQVYKDPEGWRASRHCAAAAKSVDEPRPFPPATQPSISTASSCISCAPILS